VVLTSRGLSTRIRQDIHLISDTGTYKDHNLQANRDAIHNSLSPGPDVTKFVVKALRHVIWDETVLDLLSATALELLGDQPDPTKAHMGHA
jgi:hypothetical protein